MKLNFALFAIFNLVKMAKSRTSLDFTRDFHIKLILDDCSVNGRLYYITLPEVDTVKVTDLRPSDKSKYGEVNRQLFKDELEQDYVNVIDSNMYICDPWKDVNLNLTGKCKEIAYTLPSVPCFNYEFVFYALNCHKSNGKFYYGELTKSEARASYVCLLPDSEENDDPSLCIEKDGQRYCHGDFIIVKENEEKEYETYTMEFGTENYSCSTYEECLNIAKEELDNMELVPQVDYSKYKDPVKEACDAADKGYSCCNDNEVVYSDEVGDWGIMNNRWCGVGYKTQKCGDFNCCKKCELVSEDEDGKWGVENEEWCLFGEKCLN